MLQKIKNFFVKKLSDLSRLLYGKKGVLTKEILELKNNIEQKDAKIGRLEAENINALLQYKDADQERIKLKKERDELRVKVREQTAGDLLYNAIKAVNAPKEELPKFQDNHQRLMAQYNQMRQQTGQFNFDNLLGLGGLLGGAYQQQPFLTV